MSSKLISGFWRFMLMVPPSLWEKQIAKTRKRIRRECEFMSDEHRLVHHYVVREIHEWESRWYRKPLQKDWTWASPV